MGLSPPPPPRAVPAGCRGGLPSCLAAAAGEQQDLPQGCRGEPSRSTQPVRASTQLCTRTHPGQPWGCSILQVVVGAERAAPHHPQTWGQQAHVGCTGLGVQRERGAATSLGPQGREPAAAVAPPPNPLPNPALKAWWHPCPPFPVAALAHRGGGGELEAWAGGGRCRLSADAAGAWGVGEEPPAVCVSRPAPAAECTTKTTMAPLPHATGDGDVSSVRETGTLNSLRAGRQTSVACMGRGIRVPLGCFSLVLGDAVTASGCLCVLSPLVRASPAQPWQPVHPQPALSKGREAPNFPLLLPQPMDDTASPPAPSPGRGTASKPTPCHCHGAKPNA